MSKQVSPVQIPFGPLYLAGNPIERPQETSADLDNFRLMPGGWLRMRSGQVGVYNLTDCVQVAKIHNVSINSNAGAPRHLLQAIYGGGVVKIVPFNLSPFFIDETGLEIIEMGRSQLAGADGIPILNLADSAIFYNGWGQTAVGGHTPGLSQYVPTATVRFFGLHPQISGSVPNVSFAAGAGNNQVVDSVEIWAGLYNDATEHYSNAIKLGTITTTGATGTITANNLASIITPTHGAGETANQYIVFYASIDGSVVKYQILNAALDGPFKVAIGSSSASLSISASTDNGWVLDLTKEMPLRNYPARRMRSMCLVSGRLYGVLDPNNIESGDTNSPFFTRSRDLAGVVWSEAEGQARTQDFLGDPLQCWPPQNFTPTPSGERPLYVHPSDSGFECLVFTATRVYVLSEQSDGLQEWSSVSETHGLIHLHGERTVVTTRHGILWVTQRRQIAKYSEGRVEILSSDYDAILRSSGLSIRCAGYVYDPPNSVDRYQVYYEAAGLKRSICHDFRLGPATTTEALLATAAAQIRSDGGLDYHIVAQGDGATKCALYAIEGQPDLDYQVYRLDRVFTGTSGQTSSDQNIPSAVWESQWMDFGDANLQKELPHFDVIGDLDELSGSFQDVKVFKDFQNISVGWANPTRALFRVGDSDSYWRFTITQFHGFWWKFRITYPPPTTGLYYSNPATEGGLASNFYASLMKLLVTIGQPANRK